MKEFIASCGTYSNLVKQAKSKQKILDKMYEAGLTPPVVSAAFAAFLFHFAHAHTSALPQRKERTFNFDFPSCDKLPPPVLPFIGVSFSYSGKKEEYLCVTAFLVADVCSR